MGICEYQGSKLIYNAIFDCQTKIYYIAYPYYWREPSESLVLNVEMLLQTLFSIGMK